jgi:hypothetical protein
LAGLEALRKALEDDDPALIQGQNVLPPPLHIYKSDEVTAACAICFTAWKGDCGGRACVADLDIGFAEVCYQAGQLLREPGAVRFFLIQYDSWTREEMRQNLLTEVERTLVGRRRDSGQLERTRCTDTLAKQPERRVADSEIIALPSESATAKPTKKMASRNAEERRASEKKTS